MVLVKKATKVKKGFIGNKKNTFFKLICVIHYYIYCPVLFLVVLADLKTVIKVSHCEYLRN